MSLVYGQLQGTQKSQGAEGIKAQTEVWALMPLSFQDPISQPSLVWKTQRAVLGRHEFGQTGCDGRWCSDFCSLQAGGPRYFPWRRKDQVKVPVGLMRYCGRTRAPQELMPARPICW